MNLLNLLLWQLVDKLISKQRLPLLNSWHYCWCNRLTPCYQLHDVMEWSQRNNMALHKDKFEYMCHKFNKNRTLPELPFICEFYQYKVSAETSLEPVHQLRDLGILISRDLSWSPHIRAIAEKVRQKASWVLSVFHTRSPTIMLTLYKSMVRSLVEYCCPLWHPMKISDVQELESVQKTFISRIAGMRDMHYWDCLVHLSLMSLQRRRERFIILHMWKILHGKTSNDLNVQFVARPRFGNLAVIPPPRKNSSAANQSHLQSKGLSYGTQCPTTWMSFKNSSNSKISSPSSCYPSLICHQSGSTLHLTPILCCAGEMTEEQLRSGVVGWSDGPVKSWRNST